MAAAELQPEPPAHFGEGTLEPLPAEKADGAHPLRLLHHGEGALVLDLQRYHKAELRAGAVLAADADELARYVRALDRRISEVKKTRDACELTLRGMKKAVNADAN